MIVGVVCVSSLLVAAVASWLLFWFAVWMVGLAVKLLFDGGVVWVFGMAIIIRCCVSLGWLGMVGTVMEK